jgi:hypothetical protein
MKIKDPLAEAERIKRKMLSLCNGHGVFLVYMVIENILESILEALDGSARNLLTVNLIHMLLDLPGFDEFDATAASGNKHAANGDDVCNAEILRHIKVLAARARLLSEGSRERHRNALVQPFCSSLSTSVGERPEKLAEHIVRACGHLEPHTALDVLLGVARFILQGLPPSERGQLVLILVAVLASMAAVDSVEVREAQRKFTETLGSSTDAERDSAILGLIRALALESSITAEFPQCAGNA